MRYRDPPDAVAARTVEGLHWASIREARDVPALVRDGVLTLPQLKVMDSFLVFLTSEPDRTIDADLFLEWGQERTYAQFGQLRAAFRLLFEPGPAHRQLDCARAEKVREGKPPKRPYPQRARRFSVFPQELPPAWQTALTDMEQGLSGIRCAAPAPSLVTTTRVKLCELAKILHEEMLDPQITVEALLAYERSLHGRERSLSPRTILSSLRQLRDFGRYIGVPEEVEGHLASRLNFWDNKAERTTPLKEAKVLTLPTYAEILEVAFDLLGEADRTAEPIKAQQCRNFAVALALMCPFPLRLADTDLHFGREVLWDGLRYSFDIRTSKTGEIFRPTILLVFGFFIDQLVLQGSHPDHLDALREECLATQRPLFVNHRDGRLHAGFVSYAWRQVLGTGCHVARGKIHDQLAALGQEGVELAMRACTHRSEKTAEFYRSRAFDLLMIRGAHERITNGIAEDEWDEYFA